MILDSNNNPLLNAALSYAAQGWPVIPLHTVADGTCTCESQSCTSPAKHPLTAKGVHDATTDTATICRWWTEAAIANVGIATGNGLLVLDIDAKHGGLGSLAQLEAQYGPLPQTPTVSTGGGGRHYYFRLPVGMAIGNRAGLATGIDVRGDNGYVVAPPSLHASGETYQWTVPPDVPLAEPPPWLLAMLGCRCRDSQSDTTNANGVMLKVQPTTEDLANHPGIGEGQRNATLCKLVGVHLARGDNSEAIEPLALAWAERCSPPLEEAEVVRTLNSLATKHQRTTVIIPTTGDADELDDLPLPEPKEWPTLDEAALHGLLGDIVRMLEPETEADPFGILLSTLVVFGNAVGRGPFYPVEGDQHHVNLFAVMVGESSRGRKGTSLGRTLSLFEDAEPAWKADCITNGLSSGEGLIWAVRDPVEATEPVKEKGKITGYQTVIKDGGVTDKRLLVIEPEFAQMLKVLRREGNTLSPVVRQAWDSGVLTAMTKNNFAKASGTHVSILGHITRPELEKSLCDTDCFNGFANRFLWALVRRSKLLPDGGRGLDLAPLRQRITTALTTAKGITAMHRRPAARALWHELYPELTAERPGLYGAVVGRGEAQTLRLSMLYALLDGMAVIDVPHLQAATAIWRYCEASARLIFTQNEDDAGDALERLLLEKIKEEPGINRRGLHRAIGGHIPAKDMVKALASLRDGGDARCELVATGGRPSECWFPAAVSLPVMLTPPVAAESTAPASANAEAVPTATANAAPLSLPELFEAVSRIGGRLRRDESRCVVDAPADRITPDITAAVAEHEAVLLAMLPATEPAINDATPAADDIVLTDEAFYNELMAM